MEAILGLVVFLLLFTVGRSLWRRKYAMAALSFSAIVGLALSDAAFDLTGTALQSTDAEAVSAAAAPTTSTLPKSQEVVWIRSNQRLVAAKMKDPQSATFEGDFVSYRTGAPVVCGTVNAKNSFGGYAGPQRYIGGGETIGVFLASEVSGFEELWREMCD